MIFYSNRTIGKPKYRKMSTEKEMEEVRQFLKWRQMLLPVYGYSPLICECGTRMEGKRLRLKSEIIDGEKMVRMEYMPCHGRGNVEADITFECWEFDGGPFPMFECPFCGSKTMIPRQVIEETKAEEEKEKHLGRPKRKRNNTYVQ